MPAVPADAKPLRRAFIYALFAIIVIVTVCVPLYNRIEPSWYGIPFFYWFQLAWILVAAAATLLAYVLKL